MLLTLRFHGIKFSNNVFDFIFWNSLEMMNFMHVRIGGPVSFVDNLIFFKTSLLVYLLLFFATVFTVFTIMFSVSLKLQDTIIYADSLTA